MSREALATILGRAALDQGYLKTLMRSPKAAAKDMRLKLDAHEVAALHGLAFKSLQAFHQSVKKKKLPRPHFDFMM